MHERTERLLQLLMDIGERIFSVLLFTIYAVRQWHSFTLKPYNVLAVISEAVVVAFIVVRRPALSVSTRPLDWFVAFAGTALPMMAVAGGKPLLSIYMGFWMMTFGLVLSLWAKLIIRRGFGIASANRGVVAKGPYRFVRHPMYAGYLFVHLGYLLMNPVLWNAVLYIVVWCFQIARILVEERLLQQDPAYQTFASKVGFRLLPGLF